MWNWNNTRRCDRRGDMKKVHSIAEKVKMFFLCHNFETWQVPSMLSCFNDFLLWSILNLPKTLFLLLLLLTQFRNFFLLSSMSSITLSDCYMVSGRYNNNGVIYFYTLCNRLRRFFCFVFTLNSVLLHIVNAHLHFVCSFLSHFSTETTQGHLSVSSLSQGYETTWKELNSCTLHCILINLRRW